MLKDKIVFSSCVEGCKAQALHHDEGHNRDYKKAQLFHDKQASLKENRTALANLIEPKSAERRSPPSKPP